MRIVDENDVNNSQSEISRNLHVLHVQTNHAINGRHAYCFPNYLFFFFLQIISDIIHTRLIIGRFTIDLRHHKFLIGLIEWKHSRMTK